MPGVAEPEVLEVMTPQGVARLHVHRGARGALVLGHGAGGGVTAPDLRLSMDVARAAGWTGVLVEQPYRVAGRRAPDRAPRLDAAWTAVVAELAAGGLTGPPLITGGRSSGARVACRTAGATGADAVLCLAFPLRPPRRTGEAPSRLPELEAVPVPVTVVQGDRDPYGVPPAGPGREVVVVRGDHALRSDAAAVRAAVAGLLERAGNAAAGTAVGAGRRPSGAHGPATRRATHRARAAPGPTSGAAPAPRTARPWPATARSR